MKQFDEMKNAEREAIIARACKCYCDDLCEKSFSGMCYHKYDHLTQIKNDFHYNECNDLKMLINAMTQ